MSITGNRGEWSETYAFLRLLAEGNLYAADEQLNRLGDLFFPIIRIIREEHEYHTNAKTSNIDIYYNGDKIISIPTSKINIEAKKLFSDLSKRPAGKGSFSLPATESFVQSIYVSKLKARSTDKADLSVEIHDSQTGYQSVVGFSIKSDLGAPPTLLNPGKTTNFVFEVVGLPTTEIARINNINTSKKIIDRMRAIRDKGGELVFYKADSEKFEDNLVMIDSQMSIIVAEMLKGFYCRRTKECSKLAEEIAIINPLNRRKNFYTHNIKELLCAAALGMTPAAEWDGTYKANGGYIIVKEDGDVVAYHIYNLAFFKDYLLRETQLVQPSTTRYEYCSLYQENGKIYIKLNLQIRFL